MRAGPRTIGAVGAVAVAAAAGALFLVRAGQDGGATRRPTVAAQPSVIVTEAPPSPRPVGVKPSSGGSAGDAGTVAPAPVPSRSKLPGRAASSGQVEEAFVAMSAARLCAVQGQAFRTTADLESQAAAASDVELTAAQRKALAKRMATDPAFARRVTERFRALCVGT